MRGQACRRVALTTRGTVLAGVVAFLCCVALAAASTWVPSAEVSSLLSGARQQLYAGNGGLAAERYEKAVELLEWTDDDVSKAEASERLVAGADAYVGLSRSFLLDNKLNPALESVMRARKLYTMSDTKTLKFAAAGSLEAQILIKLDQPREALGSMEGAYKVALEAPGENEEFVEHLRSHLEHLRSVLVKGGGKKAGSDEL